MEPNKAYPAFPELHQFPLTEYQNKLLDNLLCYSMDLQNSPQIYLVG